MTMRPIDRNQEGAALVLALLFMLALSTVGASMLVLARTESYASMNYRMMSEARYGAESGVHRAINYLLNTYARPGGAGDPLTNYDMTVSPVTYLGQPVVLSSMADVAANYPVAAERDAFAAAVQGALAAGGGTGVRYTASAMLVSMRVVSSYGTGVSTVVQTWRITGNGALGGVRNASVEVSALLEQQVVPTHTYAAFATNPGCGALSFSGGVATDSYDSSLMTLVGGVPVTDPSHGDVGTNGNLTEGGGTTVNGSLSTPRSGVGNCKSGAVSGLTLNGNSQLTGGMVQLPQALVYPPPAAPNPMPPINATVAIVSTTSCASAGIAAANCTGAGGVLTLSAAGAPLVLGDVHVNGNATVHLTAGTYNVNSLVLNGGATLIIDSGPVIMNVAGQSQGTVLDFTGGSTSNGSFDPANFQIQYAGTGTVRLNGGTSTSAMLYAPLAQADLSGGADFYGSVLAASVNVNGGTRIHYDRRLGQTFLTVGNFMLNAFSWKKY